MPRDASYYREYRAKKKAQGITRSGERKKVYENAKATGKQEELNKAAKEKYDEFKELNGIAKTTVVYREKKAKEAIDELSRLEQDLKG